MLNEKEFLLIEEKHENWSLFANRIREGLANGTDLLIIKEYVIFYWRDNLNSNFSQEELLLLPHLNNTAYASQFRKEHEDIKDLIVSLQRDSERSMFTILSNFIDNLIRFEKLFVINFLRKNLTDDQKIELNKKLKAHYISDKQWRNDFWNSSKRRRKYIVWEKRAA